MNRSVIVATVAVVVVVAGVYALTRNSSSSSNPSYSTPSSNSASSQPSASNTNSSQANSSNGAGNVAVTGGTNGPSCGSGGYFKPSSVTIKSGETVTFSVPSNDPYAGGLQIMGLPGGTMVVPRGGSMTTSPITSTVSFNATWPNATECKKGSGTITVQ